MEGRDGISEINKNLNIHVSFAEISYFIERMNDYR